MSIYQLKSESLIVNFSSKGAEITSVKHIQTGEEFIWNADPDIWNRHSPILFPIVGKLIDNKYQFNGMEYHMGQHGFARDLDFDIAEIYTDCIRFLLQSNEHTFKLYPFEFKLFIAYKLTGNKLETTYSVHNNGEEIQYFSIGAHPAFLLPEEKLEDFIIHFNQSEPNLKSYLIQNGLLNGKSQDLKLSNLNGLNLNATSFVKDALVFKNLNSNEISIKHQKSNWQIKMSFESFPFFGIWSKYPYQKFICLEPWAGIADENGFTGEISEKEGICILNPAKNMDFSFTTEFIGTI